MKTVSDVMEAIRSNDMDALKQLLSDNKELAAAKDEKQNSAILMSIYYGRPQMTGILLEHGVRPNLFEACAGGLTSEVESMLRSQSQPLTEMSHDGWTPLHLAAFFGRLDIATILLDAGADMMIISNNPEASIPINAAAAGRHQAIVELLLHRGCPADARASATAYTALHIAAHEGKLDMIAALLRAGADRTLTTGNGETALDLAKKQGHTAAVEALLQ